MLGLTLKHLSKRGHWCGRRWCPSCRNSLHFLGPYAAKDSITGFVKHLLDWSLIYLGSAQQRGRFYRTKALATMSKGIIHTWFRLQSDDSHQPIYNWRRLGCWPHFSNYSAVYQIQSTPLLYRLFFIHHALFTCIESWRQRATKLMILADGLDILSRVPKPMPEILIGSILAIPLRPDLQIWKLWKFIEDIVK